MKNMNVKFCEKRLLKTLVFYASRLFLGSELGVELASVRFAVSLLASLQLCWLSDYAPLEVKVNASNTKINIVLGQALTTKLLPRYD